MRLNTLISENVLKSTWPIITAFESSESQGLHKSKDSRWGLTLATFLRSADVSCSVDALLRGIFIHAAAHATISARVHPRCLREARCFTISQKSGDDEGRYDKSETRRGEPNRSASTGRMRGTPHQMYDCCQLPTQALRRLASAPLMTITTVVIT